ncbi:MAG: hypothetical protein PHR16_16960 [Methylovulum sp.]|nr:hypothetical protein [Methylovulum sp.]
MNALRNSKTWLSVVLILAVLGHFGLGHRDIPVFVLCLGADGHVAVEYSGQDRNSALDETTPLKNGAKAYAIGNDSPCPSPCTDIALDGDDHTPLPLTDLAKIAIDIGLLPVLLLILLLIPEAGAFIRRPAFSEPPPFTDSRLLALRSTVLRI